MISKLLNLGIGKVVLVGAVIVVIISGGLIVTLGKKNMPPTQTIRTDAAIGLESPNVLPSATVSQSTTTKSPSPKSVTSATAKVTSANKSAVPWVLKDGVWKATGTPPACPEPVVLTPPVEIAKVTGILVSGQPRAEAWKPHGAFRFQNQTNEAIITVPMDALLIRGSRAFRNGENQYAFDFMAPCGIWYGMGHLLELSPKFLAIANTLPLVQDQPDGAPAKQQYYDIDPPISVTTGEQIATKVGYVKDHNVMVDFTVLDLRHENGDTLRPEWARFEKDFDHYAVCWLDYLPAADRDTLRGLFGSGDSVNGVKSDYCHYSENK